MLPVGMTRPQLEVKGHESLLRVGLSIPKYPKLDGGKLFFVKFSSGNLLAKTPNRKAPKDERVAAHSTMQCPMANRSLIGGAVGTKNLLAYLPATASNESSNIRFCWWIRVAQTTKKGKLKGKQLAKLMCYNGILNNQPLGNFILDVTWILPK